MENINIHIKKFIDKYSNILNILDIIFIILLSIMTIFVIAFVISILFNISPLNHITLSYFSKAFPILKQFSLNISSDSLNNIKLDDIFTLIAEILSAILAIVFSLTFISIERISEKYTPFILEMYKNDKRTKSTLYIFIFVIVGSILLILIKDLISKFALLFYSLGLIISCVFCFIILIIYYYFIIEIINPLSFASILEKKIIRYIKDEQKDKAKELITNMGDITINSLKRDEKEISMEYLSKIYSIFLVCGNKYTKYTYLNIILDSCQRILEYCIKTGNELRYMVISRYAEIPTIFNSTAVSNIKQIHKFNKDICLEYYNYLKKLFNANKLVINENDFELFKYEINSISHHFVDDPKEINKSIIFDLMLFYSNNPKIYSNKRIILQKNKLEFLISQLERKFLIEKCYSDILSEIDILYSLASNFLETKEEIDQLTIEFDKIRNNLFKYYLDSNFHKIFFIVGAYCIFNREKRDLDSNKYIRELWLHTESEDPYIINANTVPVTSDLEFLFNMLFWGGQNSRYWYDKYSFESFHDSRIYLYRYMILLLTYLRERQNKELDIYIYLKIWKKMSSNLNTNFCKDLLPKQENLLNIVMNL